MKASRSLWYVDHDQWSMIQKDSLVLPLLWAEKSQWSTFHRYDLSNAKRCILLLKGALAALILSVSNFFSLIHQINFWQIVSKCPNKNFELSGSWWLWGKVIKYKKLPKNTITRLITIPKNGNFELCAPGGEDGCENVAISFPSPASGLIKMKANWA